MTSNEPLRTALEYWDSLHHPQGMIYSALLTARANALTQLVDAARAAVETSREPASCVYIPPDDGSMWLTGCGHEHHKDADLDLYDFCPYCGKPVEEGSSEKAEAVRLACDRFVTRPGGIFCITCERQEHEHSAVKAAAPHYSDDQIADAEEARLAQKTP